MSDCRSNPKYLLEAAECALSPQAASENYESLHRIAPNPFKEGRRRMEDNWAKLHNDHAKSLIWC